jgi:hypothetical protein
MEDNKQPCLFFSDEKIDNFSKATGLALPINQRAV